MPNTEVLPGLAMSRGEWIVEALRVLNHNVEKLAVAMDDLNASQARSEASTTAALAGISTEIQQVRDAVAALSTSPSAAELAAFKARIDGNTDRLDAAVTALSGDDKAPAGDGTFQTPAA